MVPDGISKKSSVEKLFFDSECFNIPPRLFPTDFSLILSKKLPLDFPLRKHFMRNVAENSLGSFSFFSKESFRPWKILLTESRASLYIALFKWQSNFWLVVKHLISFLLITFISVGIFFFLNCYFVRLNL